MQKSLAATARPISAALLAGAALLAVAAPAVQTLAGPAGGAVTVADEGHWGAPEGPVSPADEGHWGGPEDPEDPADEGHWSVPADPADEGHWSVPADPGAAPVA